MSQIFDAINQASSADREPTPSDAPRIMLSLGSFEFSIDTAAYQTLTRNASWRWSEQQRIGKQDLLQHTGKPGRTVKLDGEAHYSFRNGVDSIDDIYDLADKAEPQQLVTSQGDVLGWWVIKEFTDTTTNFFAGGVARHKTFSVTMQHYGDNLDNP
ncbi:phage tail protein [Cedecea davisae]|uniref:phage tail protein n=1 Tax=Cedecea davisae TaxID=158484 RepID=UPI001D0A904B|nr:phage tail protein [Cedecea davisae]